MTPLTPASLPIANPAQNLLLVPLSQLRRSSRNVRGRGATAIPELAASIRRVGLLQNLTVTLAADGEHYDVVAGSRRLAALRLLAKKRHLARDVDVPCLLVADASARTASLTENLHREAMHPADQFAAFAALIAEGRSVEEIAADFAVTPLVVQRRLKLANIAPRLMADYRAGDVTLDQLMALAITDDHAAQQAAFYKAPHWQREPHALRARLTEQEIDAHRHPLAQFVGVRAYEEAGGSTRRDLFADAQQGLYLCDSALLHRLAQTKLGALAETLRGEGWAWAEAVPTLTAADLYAFERATMEPRTPSAREAKRMASLHARMQRLRDAINDAADACDDARADALQEEGDRLGERLHAIEQGLHGYTARVRALAGVIVTVDHDGQPCIHRGLLRAPEAKALRLLTTAEDGGTTLDGAATDNAPTKRACSETLARRLSAHRTAALQVELARNPQLALAALVHRLVAQFFRGNGRSGLPLGIALHAQNRLEAHAPELADASATQALHAMQQTLLADLPQDDAALLAHLCGMTTAGLLALLALGVAVTVDTVTARESCEPAALLAQHASLDMAAWWTPTAEGYFQHVSKAVIVANVQEFAPDHAARLAKLSKADAAREAERLAVGTVWLPAMLRTPQGDRNAA